MAAESVEERDEDDVVAGHRDHDHLRDQLGRDRERAGRWSDRVGRVLGKAGALLRTRARVVKGPLTVCRRSSRVPVRQSTG